MPIGKGLEALIPKKKRGSASQGTVEEPREGVFFVEISKISANEAQPRKAFSPTGLSDLALSIRNHGVLQPLIVEKHEEDTKSGLEVHYRLLAGERRLRAAKMAGLKQVPVVIRKVSDDRTRLLLSLIENVQREDLNPMERAEAFSRLRDEFGLSQQEIGERVGKSREAVANTLRLLQLDETTKGAMRKGAISEGHARALLSLDGEARKQLFARLKSEPAVSVREAEALARQLSGTSRAPVRAADPRRAHDEERLRRAFSVPARITARRERGSISLAFRSKEEFARLLKELLRKRL